MSEREPLKINRELVKNLAWLSKIKLEDDEIERLIRELDVLLGYINDVISLSVDEEELLYPNMVGHLRDDIPSFEGKGRKHINNAIEEQGFVKAPRVVSE